MTAQGAAYIFRTCIPSPTHCAIGETSSAATNLVSDKRDVSTGITAKVEVSAKVPSTPVSVNGKIGAGYTTESGNTEWNNISDDVEFNTSDYFCAGGSGCSEGQVNADSDPVPIYLDLRPMTELLGPPHFLDPQIGIDLRRAVQVELDKIDAAPVEGGEPISLYEMTFDTIRCEAEDYGTAAKKVPTMVGTGQGPFAPGQRFANMDMPVKTLDGYYLKTLAQTKTAFADACKTGDYLYQDLALDVFGIDADGNIQTLTSTNRDLSFLQTTAGNAQETMLQTPFVTRFVAPDGAPDYSLSVRLRSIGQAGTRCPAPCATTLASGTNYQPIASDTVGASADTPSFEVFPQFEVIDLSQQVTGEARRYGVTIARGVANYSAGNLPPAGLSVQLFGTIRKIDLAQRLGFVP